MPTTYETDLLCRSR